MLNWLVIPLAEVLGWRHMLVASRLVAAAATLAMGLTLWVLVKALTGHREFAAFSAVAFSSSSYHFSTCTTAFLHLRRKSTNR